MTERRPDTWQLSVLAENESFIRDSGMAARYHQAVTGRIAQLAQQRQIHEAEKLKKLVEQPASYLFMATSEPGRYGTEVHYFLSRYFEHTAQVILGSAMKVSTQKPDASLFVYDPFTDEDGYLSLDRAVSQIQVFLPTCKPETADIILSRRQSSSARQPQQTEPPRTLNDTAVLPPVSYWRMPGQR